MLKSPLVWSLVVAVLLAGGVFALLFESSGGTSADYDGEHSRAADAEPAAGGGLFDGIFSTGPDAAGEGADGTRSAQADELEESTDPRSQEAMSAEVDLVAVRKLMPNNLYWELGAPTEDPAELKKRAERKAEIDQQFGKVQANLASVDEIRDYYAFQKRKSEDYLKFLKHVTTKYGDELSVRDEGLYGLAIQLHTERVKAIPRAVQDALRRKSEHDKKRQEWLAGQN